MTTALNNLLANMKQQGMLTSVGEIPQYVPYWLKGTEYGVPATIPIQLGADIYNRGGGSDDSPIVTGEPRSAKQSFRDWWNLDDDITGTRGLVSAAGFIPGAGMFAGLGKAWGDYSYGVNPLSNLSSMTLAGATIPYAKSMEEALLLSKAGAFTGNILGDKIVGSKLFDTYIPEYTEGIKDSPWHEEAESMGLKQGTREYDHFINAVTGGLARNEKVDPEIMEAYDSRKEQRWRGMDDPDAAMYDEVFEQNMSVPSVEPYSINDFKGMFSGISETVDQAISGVSDWWDNLSFESKSTPQADLTVGDYGKQGDDTWRSGGVTYHGSYDWNADNTGYTDSQYDAYQDEYNNPNESTGPSSSSGSNSGFNDSSHNWN